MEMIRKTRKRQQVDSEIFGEKFEFIFDPALVVIEVLSRVRVIPHQKATANGPSHRMDCNDFRSKISALDNLTMIHSVESADESCGNARIRNPNPNRNYPPE